MAGDYQLVPPASDLTVTRSSADGPTATQVVTIRRDVWSRHLSATLEDPCWVHYDVSVLLRSGLLVRDGDAYSPAPVAVADLGLGVYSTYVEQISGTSELSTVLSVADLSLPSTLDLAPNPDHRVPTTFTLDDDVLVSWKVFVRDAVKQARMFAPSTPTGISRISELSSLGGAITTEFTDLGGTVDIAPPPAEQVVDYAADPAELTRRLAACER